MRSVDSLVVVSALNPSLWRERRVISELNAIVRPCLKKAVAEY